MEARIPTATVARLSKYLSVLDTWQEPSVSSDELAERAGSNSAQVRKDLSYLGAAGTRGIGYEAEMLRSVIRRTLGLATDRPVVIVGAGNLGTALARYPGFARRGFQISGLFDESPMLVGTEVAGHVVQPMDALPGAVDHPELAIGIMAVPAEAAQSVAELLVKAGFRSILNFAPTTVRVARGVRIRPVDLATELHILSHHLTREPGETRPQDGESAG